MQLAVRTTYWDGELASFAQSLMRNLLVAIPRRRYLTLAVGEHARVSLRRGWRSTGGGACTGLLIVIRFESTKLPEPCFHVSLIADGIQRLQVTCAYPSEHGSKRCIRRDLDRLDYALLDPRVLRTRKEFDHRT